MVDVSRRAARSAIKGGLPNIRFVAAAAEAPPVEIVGRASLITIAFPWGSLARGIMGADAAVLDGIAAIARPGARIEALVSVTDRDRASLGVGPECFADRAAISAAWSKAGLELLEVRPAAPGEVRATGSTWARRLDAGRARPVTRLVGQRRGMHS
jgi:16S rRNA (adenine(1408)-N(1))-methyltransferase